MNRSKVTFRRMEFGDPLRVVSFNSVLKSCSMVLRVALLTRILPPYTLRDIRRVGAAGLSDLSHSSQALGLTLDRNVFNTTDHEVLALTM